MGVGARRSLLTRRVPINYGDLTYDSGNTQNLNITGGMVLHDTTLGSGGQITTVSANLANGAAYPNGYYAFFWAAWTGGTNYQIKAVSGSDSRTSGGIATTDWNVAVQAGWYLGFYWWWVEPTHYSAVSLRATLAAGRSFRQTNVYTVQAGNLVVGSTFSFPTQSTGYRLCLSANG